MWKIISSKEIKNEKTPSIKEVYKYIKDKLAPDIGDEILTKKISQQLFIHYLRQPIAFKGYSNKYHKKQIDLYLKDVVYYYSVSRLNPEIIAKFGYETKNNADVKPIRIAVKKYELKRINLEG